MATTPPFPKNEQPLQHHPILLTPLCPFSPVRPFGPFNFIRINAAFFHGNHPAVPAK
jgi:hypothetical protein